MPSQFPPFSTARQAALELSLKSRQAYIDWHKANNPAYLPRYPNRVYKEFISWNDWLGTANEFVTKVAKVYRPFWEGVKFAQAYCAEHNISTMREWVDSEKADLPDDIPRRPDQSYEDFPQHGWKTWLGTDARGRILTALQMTHIIAFCSHNDIRVPGNYYTMLSAVTGDAEMKQKLNSIQYKDLKVIKCYKWDPQSANMFSKVMQHFTKSDKSDTIMNIPDGMLFVPNINALFFELDSILEWHTLRV